MALINEPEPSELSEAAGLPTWFLIITLAIAILAGTLAALYSGR